MRKLKIQIKRIPIKDSTNLASAGYDIATSTLEIHFQEGSVYHYFDVPERVFRSLMRATSKGVYFDTAIRNGGYKYAKRPRLRVLKKKEGS